MAILGAAGMGANLFGGMMGSRAAKKGAAAQQAAADKAAAGVNTAVNGVNPQITAAAQAAGQGVVDTSETAAQGVLDASGAAAAGVNTATGTANAGMDAAVLDANGRLNPYIDAGKTSLDTLGNLLSPDGRYTQMMDEKFSFNKDQDPAYNFVLSQAMRAMTKSQAARGGLQSGGGMKAFQSMGAGLASQEYAKQFDRFQTDRNNRGGILNSMANQLQGVAGMGLNASNSAGQNTMQGAKYTGDNNIDAATYGGNVGMQGAQYAGNMRTDASRFANGLNYDAANVTGRNTIDAARFTGEMGMQGANAQAAGGIGSANAWSNGLTGAFNTGMNTMVMGSALRPRAPLASAPTANWATYTPPAINYNLGGQPAKKYIG